MPRLVILLLLFLFYRSGSAAPSTSAGDEATAATESVAASIGTAASEKATTMLYDSIELLAASSNLSTNDNFTENTSPHPHGHVKRVKVVELRWESVHTAYIITLWLLFASVAKIIFNNLKTLTSIFPESSLVIAMGIVIGYVLKGLGVSVENYRLDSHAFFIYLLPPIIFDAGYFMPNRAFFQNVDSIMLFAIVGTIFNACAISSSLWGLARLELFSLPFSTFEILLFSSLISAVDPVAVIAVFEEIHVNDFIFVNVFGEALFNDGVTVVLYELFASFLELGDNPALPIDYAAGIASFFVIGVGGAVLGALFALLAALLTKYTEEQRVLAPLFIFLVPYMCYLTAELLSLSPIIAIAVCGMAMKQYVKGNITPAAANSVKYFAKMLAQSTETVIFMFLGLATISSAHHWDTAFVFLTIGCCLLFRVIGVIIQCAILNRFRTKKFTMVDQFILCYGGLRGAIAFGLAVSMPMSIDAKPMFVTTTIAVIYFTVFLQGSTIRPLVNCLKVERKSVVEPTMAESVYLKYLDYLMSGVEDIAGQKGHYSLIDDFERFNTKVLCPILMVNHAKTENFDATKIVRAYAKLILRDAMSATTQPVAGVGGPAHSAALNPRIARIQREALGEATGAGPMSMTCDCRPASGQHLNPTAHVSTCPLSAPGMEPLYVLFGELLDKKLDDLRQELGKAGVTGAGADDIGDDYIRQIVRQGSMLSMHSGDEDGVAGRSFQVRKRKPDDRKRSEQMNSKGSRFSIDLS